MELLEQRIRSEGVVKPGGVLKVDAFLNHQMDVALFSAMGDVYKRQGMDIALGGTSLLIVVGVALDTSRSLESYMLMRHHKGFLE